MEESNVHGDGQTKNSEENADVVMKEVVENGGDSTQPADKSSEGENLENGSDKKIVDGADNGGESNETVAESGVSPDDTDDFPGIKSELVVLDEVGESNDGKEDNGDSSADSKEGSDANTSSAAAGGESDAKDVQKKNIDDPYAYVKRDDFTSEKYKIEIRGLPRYFGFGELKKFLNDKLKLASHKMKPTKNRNQGVFVCFKNEEDRQAAIKTVNRTPWKGKQLSAVSAKPAPDPLVKKRKLENEAAANDSKKPRISDDEKLRNSTTPYWNLSYDEQLKKKYEYVMKIMGKLAEQISIVNPMLSGWMKRQKSKYNGMACKLLDIRRSPVCDGYRNKCEFTIGINEETKQRMVGFRLGSYVQGHVGVGPIDSLKHIPQRMKDTVKVFEKFIKESPRGPFNPETHVGHWRQLTLRLTTLDQLMVVVLVNSKGASPEELNVSKEEVKDFFEKGDGKDLKVDSLYFLAFGKREAGKDPPKMEHLSGLKYITESILGLKFRISPEAFFQVNTPGAGILYSTVGEVIELSPSTTIVDVCCGTGTIGLSLAKDCGQVLGLEVVAPAVEDAKVNATENNITNVDFFTGRAEDILTSVLTRAKGDKVYAIVDPPRSGLQHKAIVSLRGAEVIDKIVYVSCDPNAAMKNFVDLARITSKVYHNYPLVPITAIPVDMFPHTAHCEVVILFHRVNPLNLPKTYPAKEDDIALLAKTLTKSPQDPPPSTDSEKKEDGAGNGPPETGCTEPSEGDTINDSKNSDGVGKDKKEGPVSGVQLAADRLKPKRRRPGRNMRLLSRGLLVLGIDKEKELPQSSAGPKVFVGCPAGPKKPANTFNKPEIKNKMAAPGKITKMGPKGPFTGNFGPKGQGKFKPGGRPFNFQNFKTNPKLAMKEKKFIPKQGGPGNKRKWKNDELPFRGGVITHDEDMDEGFEGPVPRQSYPRRGPWKEGQQRNVRGRSPPPSSARGDMRRGGGESDEAVWERLEQGVRNWIEEKDRRVGSPARKLMRRDTHAQGSEDRGGGYFSPNRPNFRDEWTMHSESRPGNEREGEARFERMRPDAVWEKRRRESLSPQGRYEGEEFMERMDDESWGPGGRTEEEFSFRRRKHSGGNDSGRPHIGDVGERHSRRSCERFNRRSPETLRRRSSDRFDRRFCEGFEHRPMDRYERRSSERLDRRSPERFSRGPCERCDRRSSERAYRPEPGRSVDDYIESRPKTLVIERDTIAPKYAQRMERYAESEVRLRGNNESPNQREFIGRSTSPRKMVGVLGSMELHRKNEVIMYRGPNDAAIPLPIDLEGRIAVAHSGAENRGSHYEKRFETNVLRRNYDVEEPGGQNDHSVITRRVEVIRRPIMVDDKYRMLVDSSGKSLGTAEVLLVTAKNQVYDADDRAPFNPSEGPSSSRILEQREVGMMCPDNKFNNHPEGLSGRPHGNWAMGRGQMEMPRPWGDMERSNLIRDQTGIPDTNIPKLNYPMQDAGDGLRGVVPPMKNPGAAPNAQMISYPMPQAYRQKPYDSEPNSQFPPNVPSHFSEEIPVRSHPNQNAPFSFAPSANSRTPAPYQNPNSSSIRSPLISQKPPIAMGPGSSHIMPLMAPNQLHHMPGPVGDIPIRQRMPSIPSNPVSDSRINAWNFRQPNPWGGINQQTIPPQKHW